MRCPKCNSRAMIPDHDDVPGGRQRAMLCVACGRRVIIEQPVEAGRGVGTTKS